MYSASEQASRSVPFLISSIQLSALTDQQTLMKAASNSRTCCQIVLHGNPDCSIMQAQKLHRRLTCHKSLQLRPYQRCHPSLVPLFPRYYVQHKRPYVVIHHTSAVYRPLGGYPLIHTARGKPAIHSNNNFKQRIPLITTHTKPNPGGG